MKTLFLLPVWLPVLCTALNLSSGIPALNRSNDQSVGAVCTDLTIKFENGITTRGVAAADFAPESTGVGPLTFTANGQSYLNFHPFYSGAGTIPVIVTVTDRYYNSDQCTAYVKIENDEPPLLSSPAKKTSYQPLLQVVGSGPAAQSLERSWSLQVFPNAAGGILTIQPPNCRDCWGELQIFNPHGQVQVWLSNLQERIDLDVSQWLPGSYFLRWIDDNGLVQTRQVVVQR